MIADAIQAIAEQAEADLTKLQGTKAKRLADDAAAATAANVAQQSAVEEAHDAQQLAATRDQFLAVVNSRYSPPAAPTP